MLLIIGLILGLIVALPLGCIALALFTDDAASATGNMKEGQRW